MEEKKKVTERLDDEIEAQFKSLSALCPGSEEHTKATEDLVKLCKLRNETKDVWDRILDYGLKIGDLVLPLAAYGHWFRKGLKFEETGTLASPVFRNLWSKFKPRR